MNFSNAVLDDADNAGISHGRRNRAEVVRELIADGLARSLSVRCRTFGSQQVRGCAAAIAKAELFNECFAIAP
jgi:hypothetical protein